MNALSTTNTVNPIRAAADAFLANHSTSIKELGKEFGRGETFRANPYLVNIKEGWNCRDFSSPENKEHVTKLAHSIKEVGVEVPLTVYREDDKMFLVDGESRLRATIMAIEELGATHIESIPLINVAKGTDDVDKLFAQQIRNSGKPFTALEQGNLFKRLMGFGVKIEEIARRSGLSVQHVNNLIDFQSAPVEIKEMVVNNEVSQTLAQQVVRESKGDSKAAIETLATGLEEAKKAGKNKVTAKVLNTKRTPASGGRVTVGKPTLKLVEKTTTQEESNADRVGLVSFKSILRDILGKVTEEVEGDTSIVAFDTVDWDWIKEQVNSED